MYFRKLIPPLECASVSAYIETINTKSKGNKKNIALSNGEKKLILFASFIAHLFNETLPLLWFAEC